MDVTPAVSKVGFGATITALVVDPDGNVVDRREGHNLMTAVGLTAIAQALMWSGVEDVADSIGVTGPLYLAPVWGAVGTGSTTPVSTLTALVAETTRAAVTSAGYSGAVGAGSASTTFLFFIPGPITSWALTEAGLFASAASTPGSGTLLDYFQFSPTLNVVAPNSLVLQATFAVAEA